MEPSKQIKKGDIVETPIGEETAWCVITGDHNDGCFQGRIGTPLDFSDLKVGQYIQIPRGKILRVLEKNE